MWYNGIVVPRDVRSVVRCGFKLFLTLHRSLFLWSHVWCSVVQCGLKFSQNYNCIAPYFCGHMYSMVYKMRFEWLEVGIFFKFWAFSIQSKTNFPFVLGQVLNYWANFSLFWVGFPSQHLLELSNFFFFFEN